MTRTRGAVLVAVLLLAVVFLVGGIALTTQQKTRYAAVAAEAEALQALTLAESGLEDARVKLEKDPDFPPPGAPDQESFTYTEVFAGVGSYTVTVDSRYLRPPFEFYLVRSVGKTEANRVRQTISAEIAVETRRIMSRGYERI